MIKVVRQQLYINKDVEITFSKRNVSFTGEGNNIYLDIHLKVSIFIWIKKDGIYNFEEI